MTTTTYKVLKNDANGLVYANPLKPDSQVRFKTTAAKKGMNGVSVQNYITEIVLTENNTISIGAVSAQDPLSVRIRTSGTGQSIPRVKQLLLSMVAQLDEWASEDVLIGFTPVTAPIVTDPTV